MAKRSPKGALSHLQSEIVNALADVLDKVTKTECTNSEEMLAELGKVNTKENIEKLVAFSMDVVKLYQSLKSKEVAKLMSKAYLETDVEVAVEQTELGLYLALIVIKEELARRGLGRVTHAWKKAGSNRGACSGITTAEVLSRRKVEHKEGEHGSRRLRKRWRG